MATEEVVLFDVNEDVDSLTRDELKDRCRIYGIKLNLSTKELRFAADRLAVEGSRGKPSFAQQILQKRLARTAKQETKNSERRVGPWESSL